MEKKNDLELLSNDISQFIAKRNLGQECSEILNNELPNLKTVYHSLPKLRGFIDNLSNSSILKDINEQDMFFKSHYFEFLEGKSGGTIPSSVLNVIQFHSNNEKDSYFQFKDIYDYVFSSKSKTLRETYNLCNGEDSMKALFAIGAYYHFCSVCQQQICIGTRDLDHFLNKKYYPILSLSSFNLVPMCSICNRKFKKTKLPDVPVVHPYDVEFPIKNIPIYLKKLSEIEIDENILEDKYLNFIKLTNLKSRLNHEDIKKIVVDLLSRIEIMTEEKVRQLPEDKWVDEEIFKSVSDSITDCLNFYSLQPESFTLIRIKLLHFLSEDSLSQKQIAFVLLTKMAKSRSTKER